MIEGLGYVKDFITQEKHDELIKKIDEHPWLTDLKRRVQHYGYKYDYKSRSIDHTMKIGSLPSWAEELAVSLTKYLDKADQVIVNEYMPGQGIANHIDCVPCFENTIISLSLGSPCAMVFKRPSYQITALVEPRSLIILEGESRYKWTHGIPARKTDKIGGEVIERGRRISLTFRKVILK